MRRYQELVDEGRSRKQIARALYDEGFLPKDIMMHHLPLRGLKKEEPGQPPPSQEAVSAKVTSPKAMTDEGFQSTILGYTKGEGYIDDLKRMVKFQVARSRELTEAFYSFGFASMLAALTKSGLTIDAFRKLTQAPSSTKEALDTAGMTIFKALENYNADLIPKIEGERDEARFAASQFEAQVDELKKQMAPMFRLENMIYKLAMLSGQSRVDPVVITELLDRWLQMQFPIITAEEGA